MTSAAERPSSSWISTRKRDVQHTPPIVRNGDRTVAMYDHYNFRTVSCQRLIDRIIDDLEYHVMQTCTIIGVANVHTWTLSNSIQTFHSS